MPHFEVSSARAVAPSSARLLCPTAPKHCPTAPKHSILLLQRYIVRIIFMVPMYSICSFPSLIHPDQAIYWNTVRDW